MLREIKNEEDLAILTSSQARGDIDQALGLHANGYLIKSIDSGRLLLLLKTVQPDAGGLEND